MDGSRALSGHAARTPILKWWVIDKYGLQFEVVQREDSVNTRIVSAAGPFETKEEAEEWAREG